MYDMYKFLPITIYQQYLRMKASTLLFWA